MKDKNMYTNSILEKLCVNQTKEIMGEDYNEKVLDDLYERFHTISISI